MTPIECKNENINLWKACKSNYKNQLQAVEMFESISKRKQRNKNIDQEIVDTLTHSIGSCNYATFRGFIRSKN